MFAFRKNLVFRITLSILLPILILGTALYFFVTRTLSDFTKEQIHTDLYSLSRRIYNICNITFDNLLLSGLADDADTVIITQALTLDRVEDFFIQEGLKGYIINRNNDEIIFKTELPGELPDLGILAGPAVVPIAITLKNKKYYVFAADFLPWKWQFFVIKDAQVYSDLIIKIERLQLITVGSLVLIAILLVFFIYRSIHGPTRAIISHIEQQKKPDYKGIDVFEFLSVTIADMMDALRSSEEKYRMILENSSLIVWEIDPSTRFTFISQNVKQILGYTPSEMIGEKPFKFIQKKDIGAVEQMFAGLMNGHSLAESVVHTVHHKQGQEVVFETSANSFFDEQGTLLGFRGIHRNITEQVLAERDKIQAQKIAADKAKQALVGQVAGKMAHDFNNILGIIMGTSELALMQTEDPEAKKNLQVIFDQTLRGKNLTKNLVAFAKDQEPKQEYFNVNEIIELVLNLMKKDLTDIRITPRLAGNVPPLLADPGMIEHALVNLIQNSIHALSQTSDPEISIGTHYTDKDLFIEVADNGCGIPETHLEDIFTPSFTLKGNKDVAGYYHESIKGTGYGMSNIKKYIQQHKGTISVDSKQGEYTRVVLRLPLIKQELSEKEKIKIKSDVYFSNKHLLIVEDEISISQVQRHILSQPPCSHDVDVASNGKQAIDLFETNTYDLISLDFILPGNLSGMDVYHHIRKMNSSILILFLSGNIEFLESIKHLKDNDPYIDHLSKPCQHTEYIGAVNRLFARQH